MIIPRFSLRNMLLVISALSVVCLVYGLAFQGQPWAIATALTTLLVAVLFGAYAATFTGCWLLTLAANQLSKQGGPRQSPFAAQDTFTLQSPFVEANAAPASSATSATIATDEAASAPAPSESTPSESTPAAAKNTPPNSSAE